MEMWDNLYTTPYGQAPPFLHKGRHLVGLRSCFYALTLPSLVLHIESTPHAATPHKLEKIEVGELRCFDGNE